MTIEESLIAALTAGIPGPTSAGNRVHAVLRPQDEATPAISYQRISSVPVADFDGDAGVDNARVQIDCWGLTYGAAKTLAREARVAITAADLHAYVMTDRDDIDEETGLYRVSMDVSLWGSF